MNFWSLFFSVILLFWITFCSYLYTCKYLELCESTTRLAEVEAKEPPKENTTKPEKETPTESTEKPEGLKVFYKSKPLFESDDNYNFESAGLLSFSPKVGTIHDSIRAFMKKNPDKQLKITGQYLKSEKNTTKFDNLGLARADQIAQLLIKNGVDANQVLTYIDAKDQMPQVDNNYFGGVTFEIVDKPKEEPEKESPKEEKEEKFKLTPDEEKLLFATQHVYFDLASSYATINEAYIELLIKYLKANPKTKVSIIGHTDSLGEKAKNIKLSQERAENVKKLMVQRGVNVKNLTAKGEGQDKPVADNDTETGRSKNRRVEIKIKK